VAALSMGRQGWPQFAQNPKEQSYSFREADSRYQSGQLPRTPFVDKFRLAYSHPESSTDSESAGGQPNSQP
jgi:hypothetical protein